MQILAHRGDLRVAERGLLEDLADLRAVERGRLGDLLDRRGVERSLLEEGPDRRVVERSLLGEPPDRRVADRRFLGDLPDLRVAERDLLEELPPLRHQLAIRRELDDVEQRAPHGVRVSPGASVVEGSDVRAYGLLLGLWRRAHWPFVRGGGDRVGRARVERAGELLEELPPCGGHLVLVVQPGVGRRCCRLRHGLPGRHRGGRGLGDRCTRGSGPRRGLSLSG